MITASYLNINVFFFCQSQVLGCLIFFSNFRPALLSMQSCLHSSDFLLTNNSVTDKPLLIVIIILLFIMHTACIILYLNNFILNNIYLIQVSLLKRKRYNNFRLPYIVDCRGTRLTSTLSTFHFWYSYSVKRMRLRQQICLNLTPVSICLNFRLIVYFIETQVQQPKIIETCVSCSKLILKILKLSCDSFIIDKK